MTTRLEMVLFFIDKAIDYENRTQPLPFHFGFSYKGLELQKYIVEKFLSLEKINLHRKKYFFLNFTFYKLNNNKFINQKLNIKLFILLQL